MEIEEVEFDKLERIPLLVVERAELEEGLHATVCRFNDGEISPGAIISAVTNIISSFIDYCPEHLQNEMEEHIYSEVAKSRLDRFDKITTIKES